MCGISGFITRPGERAEETLLAAMNDRLAHRGPDSAGYFFDGNVGLGHRRLSIIDTSRAADQPLGNENGSVQAILNGEIYNFQAHVAELEGLGHCFKTRSDTEVAIHGWEAWGPSLLERLRGMFVLVIYDRNRRLLFVARDRLGKKPFYYARTAAGFAFGSEIKALLAVPGVDRTLDRRAAAEHLVYGNTVGEGSIYRGIRRLLPGHSLTLSTDDPALTPKIDRFWRFEPRPEPALDEVEWLDEVDRTLAESVRLRMIADVPLGAFLSGGIDSSLIVAHMAKLSPGRVKTFCVGFEEAAWDEREHARKVADFLGTEHHVEVVRPDALAVLPELVACYDEPFGDPSAIPTYYVAKLTRPHVTVALSGDGGDELFCGYRRYVESAFLESAGTTLTPLGRPLARRAARLFRIGSFPRRALDRMSRRGFELYHHAHGFAPEYLSLLSPELLAALGPGAERPERAEFERQPGLPFLDRCRAMDLSFYLPDQILVKMDRASMRHSLEVRCPLLDHQLVALAGRMPASRQHRGFDQKLLLKKLAYRHVPKALVDRPKQGFAVPLERWFRGPLAAAFERALADERSLTWRLFDRAEASRRFESHRRGRGKHHPVLWRLLFFHAWAEQAEVTE